jgi:4-amino-4-deoxy-L-arabinose transferase-like glycosyltransferase
MTSPAADKTLREKEEGTAEFSARMVRFAREHWTALLVLGIMIAAFGIRMYYLSKHSEYTADSYYFLLLARSIRDTFTYTIRGVTHTKYLPGYPGAIWLGSYLVGGLERSANLIAILGATFTVGVTYGLGREFFNKWAGLVAALIVAFQPTFLKWTTLPMTEGLFTFLFAGGIYLLLTGCKRAAPTRRALGALSGGLCLLTRWEGILFLPLMVVIALLYMKEARFRYWEPPVMLLLFGLPIGAYVTRNLIATGEVTHYIGEYREYSTKVTFSVLKHRVKVYGWNGMSDAAFAVFFGLGSVWCLVRRRFKQFLIVVGWFALFLVFHLFWYYAYERFMAPAVPAVALIIGFLFVDLALGVGTLFAADGWVSKKVEQRSGGEPAGAAASARSKYLWAGKVLCYCVLAAALVTLVLHGAFRADAATLNDARAFSDDHGGQGMKQAAAWLNKYAPGRLVASDAGPFFNWLYYPGDVLYLRPVPWDLPVEDRDISPDDAPRQLYSRGVRYLVIGQTEKGVEDELVALGLAGVNRQELRDIASWVNHYEYPQPHDLTTVLFEVLPPH